MSAPNPHIYEEIAEAFRRQIAQGTLRPGDRLPTVRALAQEWGCTTGTVNRAYGLLAEEGLISSHRGGGTKVTANPLPPEKNAIAWGMLVNQAERFLMEVLGQGYTPTQVETAVSVALSRWQTLQENLPPSPGPEIAANALQFVGSHDLTMELLARQLHASNTDYELQLSFRGSLGGLIALARHEADIAGSHLWDESSDTYNIPFVRRILPGQRVALVTVAKRSIGLILPPGNPLHMGGLADLTAKEIHWVNRQAGSGTRVWLDAQLQQLGLETGAIPGYDREKATHLQVAQAIKDGTANAGLGLQAAAAAYGLDFVPLTNELYQLVIPERVWDTDVCRRLVTILHTSIFKNRIEALTGYDNRTTGDVVWIS